MKSRFYNCVPKFIIIPLVLTIISVISCSSEKSRWVSARIENSIESYENYIKENEGSEYISEAQLKLAEKYEERDWEATILENSIKAYNVFIEKYPFSSYKQAAFVQLATLHYEIAQQKNTIHGYENYIQTYLFYDEIQKALDRLEQLCTERDFLRAKKLDEPRLYNEFLMEHPNSKYTHQIKTRLQELLEIDWTNAQSIESFKGYENFLRRHPNSIYSETAYERLAKLEMDTLVLRFRNDLKDLTLQNQDPVLVVEIIETFETPHFVYRNNRNEYFALYYYDGLEADRFDWRLPNWKKNRDFQNGIDLPVLKSLPPFQAVVFFHPYDSKSGKEISKIYESLLNAYESERGWQLDHTQVIVSRPRQKLQGIDMNSKVSLADFLLMRMITFNSLISHLNNGTQDQIVEAATLLGILKSPHSVKTLINVLTNSNENLRKTILLALIRMGKITCFGEFYYRDEIEANEQIKYLQEECEYQRTHRTIDLGIRSLDIQKRLEKFTGQKDVEAVKVMLALSSADTVSVIRGEDVDYQVIRLLDCFGLKVIEDQLIDSKVFIEVSKEQKADYDFFHPRGEPKKIKKYYSGAEVWGSIKIGIDTSIFIVDYKGRETKAGWPGEGPTKKMLEEVGAPYEEAFESSKYYEKLLNVLFIGRGYEYIEEVIGRYNNNNMIIHKEAKRIREDELN